MTLKPDLLYIFHIFSSFDLAIIIASAAAAFTGYQALLTRKHNRLSVKPHLAAWTFDSDQDNEYIIYFHLENNGLGPAIIDSFEVFFDKEKLGDTTNDGKILNTLISQKVSMQKGILKHTVSLLGYNASFPAGKREVLFAIHTPTYSSFSKEPFQNFMDRFDLDIHYSSIYGEKYMFSTKDR